MTRNRYRIPAACVPVVLARLEEALLNPQVATKLPVVLGLKILGRC